MGLDRTAARALLAAAAEHSPRLNVLVALLLFNGLRISEGLGLDVDDVADYDRGRRIARLHRKGGRAARAALPPAVAAAVDAYLEHRADLEDTRPVGTSRGAARGPGAGRARVAPVGRCAREPAAGHGVAA